MVAWHKVRSFISKNDFLSYLLALTISLTLIGYAPSSIALGLFVFFAIRYKIRNRTPFKFNIALVLPTLLYLGGCASYLWTADTVQTLKGMGRLPALMLLPLVCSFLPKISLTSFNVIFNWFTISNLALGVFFIGNAALKYLENGIITVFTYHDLVEVLDLNAIYVSVFYAISYFYVLSKTRKSNWRYGVMIFLGVMIMLLSSKIIIVSFLIGNILYFIAYKGFKALKSKKIILAIILVSGALYFTSKEFTYRLWVETSTNIEEVVNREKFNKIYPWTGTSIRLLQLRILKKQIREDGIFWKGFGLFASRNNVKERHINFNTYYGYHDYNYHNQYAQVLAELGVFALLALLLILLFGIKKAINKKHFLMFMFYFLMFMVFMTESFLWVQRGLFIFIICHAVFNKLNFNNLDAKTI